MLLLLCALPGHGRPRDEHSACRKVQGCHRWRKGPCRIGGALLLWGRRSWRVVAVALGWRRGRRPAQGWAHGSKATISTHGSAASHAADQDGARLLLLGTALKERGGGAWAGGTRQKPGQSRCEPLYLACWLLPQGFTAPGAATPRRGSPSGSYDPASIQGATGSGAQRAQQRAGAGKLV